MPGPQAQGIEAHTDVLRAPLQRVRCALTQTSVSIIRSRTIAASTGGCSRRAASMPRSRPCCTEEDALRVLLVRHHALLTLFVDVTDVVGVEAAVLVDVEDDETICWP